jgi:transposase
LIIEKGATGSAFRCYAEAPHIDRQEGTRRPDDTFGVGPDSQIPAAFWEQMVRVLPPPTPREKDGRPRMDDCQAMTAILYVLRTGCQWKALPRSLGAPSTVHDRFQAWRDARVFERLWQAGLLRYDELKGIEWEWQAMDGAMTKAPLGEEQGGQEPHRSRQARDQTERANRWLWYSTRSRGGRG